MWVHTKDSQDKITPLKALESACDNIQSGHLTGLLQKIKPAIDQEATTRVNRNGRNWAFVANVSRIHVHLMMQRIREQSVLLNQLVEEGRIMLAGALYDIDSGEVSFFDD